MNLHCRDRAHCQMCRTSQAVRTAHGFPDVCPNGITADNIPKPKPTERDRALQAAARGEVYAPPGRCKGCGG